MDNIFTNRACPLCGVMPKKKEDLLIQLSNETQLRDDIRDKIDRIFEEDRYLVLFPWFDWKSLKDAAEVTAILDVVSVAMCDFFLREKGGLKYSK